MDFQKSDSDAPSVNFFSDQVSYKIGHQRKIIVWLENFARAEGKHLRDINIILTTDAKLLEINRKFLKHDDYTDIITFQNVEGVLSGEMYISLDRLKDNSKKNGEGLLKELHRVMIHGMLHMAGYSDTSESDKLIMRSRENFYLNLRNF